MTFSSRLVGAMAVATVLALPGAAAAQTTTVDCSAEAVGSAAAVPAECQVAPEVVEREFPEEPTNPAPIPQTAPEVLTATGVDSDVLALVAGGAIVAGGAALFLSRRRSHADLDA